MFHVTYTVKGVALFKRPGWRGSSRPAGRLNATRQPSTYGSCRCGPR
ncbi:hypothetical protein BOQ63_001285 (plasmid) [Streptomyces viridifaciens]|nr:hypothetical protein BOQ63_001285 [Streptomyces viridifaciens]